MEKEIVYAVVTLEWFFPDVELFELKEEAEERAKELNGDILKLKIKRKHKRYCISEKDLENLIKEIGKTSHLLSDTVVSLIRKYLKEA